MLTKLREKLSGLRTNLAFDNGWLLVLQRLFCRRLPVAVYQRGELVFLTDFEGGDAMGVRHLLTADMYSRFYPRIVPLVKGELTVLDLGANGGGFALSLDDRGLKFSTAVCVEMNPHTYSRLLFNIDRNFSGRAVTVNAAVTGDGAPVEIVDSRGGTGQSMYAGEGGKISVPGVTFDELVKRYFGPGMEDLDVVKVDVEGAEFEIFLSGKGDLLRRFRSLFIEIHPVAAHSRTELVEKIQSLGFRLVGEGNDSVEHDGEQAEIFFFQRKT
jgi:FkbM family methyltransferase